MKKKILAVIMLTTLALSLVACGKQKDTGIIVSVGDVNNDSGQNALTDETNDVKEETTEVVEEETEVVITNDEYIDYITSGFVAENGDVYKFNVDGTYSCYIVETDVSYSGTYETDGKSYITLKCTKDNSSESEEAPVEEEVIDETYVEPAYSTMEPGEDGKTVVTDYDEAGNVINQYIIDEVFNGEPSTEETEETEKEEPVLNEITYKLTRTTTTDEYENVIEIVILSKGETKIILQKQFDLS